MCPKSSRRFAGRLFLALADPAGVNPPPVRCSAGTSPVASPRTARRSDVGPSPCRSRHRNAIHTRRPVFPQTEGYQLRAESHALAPTRTGVNCNYIPWGGKAMATRTAFLVRSPCILPVLLSIICLLAPAVAQHGGG